MFLVLCLHLILMVGHASTTTATGGAGCPEINDVSLSIGGVVDGGSRMGREQEVAMKMAIEDFSNEQQASKECSNHYKLQLHLVDSHGSSARAVSAAMKLIDVDKVGSLVGRLELPQAEMISEIGEKSTQIPLILLNPTALTPPLVQSQSQNLIQMSDDITVHAQCIAAIVGYFRWSKVTIIYEQGAFTLNSGIITILSDALKSVEATIEQYKAFPPPKSSAWDLAYRCEWADFTQPYVKSGLALVVPVKPDTTKERWMFMEVFELKMWLLIPSMSLFIGFVVWLIEHGDDNSEFGEGSISGQVGTILWFSFAVLFFAQKESLRSNLSKLVLAPWMFLILMLTANFTAALTSKLTVAQLQPSADIDTLRRDNAIIGCNRKSFTCKFLVDVLHVKPENIREIRSIDDYPGAFQRGDIKAAAFVTEHANVFLKKYCRGFTMSGATFTFGGLGFAFQKGSPLAADVSRAILRAIESGEVANLEKDMFFHCKCSSEDNINDNAPGLGFRPFSGLFYITGGIATTVFLITIIPQMKRMLSSMAQALSRKKICPEDEASNGSKQSPPASGSG